MDNIFKVLGDEMRLRIYNLLSKEELCVCELEEVLETSQSNISRHLTRLRNENIVIFEKKAQWIFYEINPKFIESNKLLNDYLMEKMNDNEKFKKDIDLMYKVKKDEIRCGNKK